MGKCKRKKQKEKTKDIDKLNALVEPIPVLILKRRNKAVALRFHRLWFDFLS